MQNLRQRHRECSSEVSLQTLHMQAANAVLASSLGSRLCTRGKPAQMKFLGSKKGCCRACRAETSVFRMLCQPLCFHCGNVGLKSGKSPTPGQMASVGVPNFWKILNAVSISESPAKRAEPVAISANMQP